jgi:UDP-N-acetylmuramoyl-L-alanyl-D-glutamate--2,6-diaminopimelate ligase
MYTLVNALVRILKRIVPEPLVRLLRPSYHRFLAFGMALAYGFPAKKLVVLGVTGTKGKSTSAEMLFSLLRGAGHKTALLSTIRFAVEDHSEPNRFKMTLAGRGFAQAFMRRALKAGCTHLVVEVTSESVLQHRHRFLDLDGLIVTNIQKEHIESHGSFENYVDAKREIVASLIRSPKRMRVLVANADIPETRAFLALPGAQAISFSADELKKLSADERSVRFEYGGTPFTVPLPGTFNAMNALAAVKLAEAFGVPRRAAAEALAKLPGVAGRVEHIDAGQKFLVVVDYAHTPDSLTALYSAFPHVRKICVLGNTGGGRDTWKRPVMGGIADEACDKVILTNEDPYDEDPESIAAAMALGMRRKPDVIMDRREAIRAALKAAKPGDAVLISGKGTDPFIMGPRGTKEPWNDAAVVREELARLLSRI